MFLLQGRTKALTTFNNVARQHVMNVIVSSNSHLQW